MKFVHVTRDGGFPLGQPQKGGYKFARQPLPDTKYRRQLAHRHRIDVCPPEYVRNCRVVRLPLQSSPCIHRGST